MWLIGAALALAAWVIGSTMRKTAVTATVTIPADHADADYTVRPAGASSLGGPQIPTDGNTLPGSPDFGPDADPSQASYYLNHTIPGEGGSHDG